MNTTEQVEQSQARASAASTALRRELEQLCKNGRIAVYSAGRRPSRVTVPDALKDRLERDAREKDFGHIFVGTLTKHGAEAAVGPTLWGLAVAWGGDELLVE